MVITSLTCIINQGDQFYDPIYGAWGCLKKTLLNSRWRNFRHLECEWGIIINNSVKHFIDCPASTVFTWFSLLYKSIPHIEMQTELETDYIIVRIWTLSDKVAKSVFNIQLQAGLVVTVSVFLVCKYFYKRMNKEGGLVWNILASSRP